MMRIRKLGASTLWPGVPMALGSAALFGASTPASKYLLSTIDPWMLAGILYLGAGIGLFLYRMARKLLAVTSSEASLSRPDIPWLIAVILFGGIIAPILLMLGLTRTEASAASLLLNVESLATMAIAWLVFRENVDKRLLLGAAAILCGACILAWSGSELTLSFGAIFVIGACLAWGIDNNLTRKLSASDPTQVAMFKGLVAGVANIALALVVGAEMPSVAAAVAGGFLGLISIGISLVLFMLALRHLGTARTGAYYSTAPFVGALLSVLFLAEPLSVKLVIAGLLMAVGVWLHLTETHEHEHEHDELAHEHSHVHDAHHQHHHEGPVTEPHAHWHSHTRLRHKHPHFPDLHHRHSHG